MPKKDVQLGFRCSPEIHDEIRKIAFEERSSIQAFLESAVQSHLGAKRGKNAGLPPEFSGASRKELDFLEQMLYFFRHAPEDLVRSFHSTAAHFVKVGEREKQQTKRGRTG